MAALNACIHELANLRLCSTKHKACSWPHLDNIGAIAGGDIVQGQVTFGRKTKTPCGHLHEAKAQKGSHQAVVVLFCCSVKSA